MWLAQQAIQHHVIVEIGSYLGRSTRALADSTSGIVIAVDDWWGPRDVFIEDRSPIRETFVSNLRDKLDDARVFMVEGRYSVALYDQVMESLKGSQPDMVFLDGDHDLASAQRDIDYWTAHIAPGGLICGHDFLHIWPILALMKFEVPEGTNCWKLLT